MNEDEDDEDSYVLANRMDEAKEQLDAYMDVVRGRANNGYVPMDEYGRELDMAA